MARMKFDNPQGKSCSCKGDSLRELAESCLQWSVDRCRVVEEDMFSRNCFNCNEPFDIPESYYLGYDSREYDGLCPNCDPARQPEFPDVKKINDCFSLAKPSKGKAALVIVTNRITPEEMMIAMDVVMERLGPYIGITWKQDIPFIRDEEPDLTDAFNSFKGESLIDNLDDNDF